MEAKFEPRIAKVTINIGVGEAGERLEKAGKVLELLTGRKPVKTIAKRTNKEFGIRKGMPIGCKVTLRKKDAEEFLKKALAILNNKIPSYSFDDEGNFSFGIPDYTLFPDQKYDPEIGIFGMDVCVTIERIGYRIKHRKIRKRKIPARHRVKREEAMEFVKKKFNVEVI
ncbi:MAG TPA: 50S ribosomal protein L5 [Thermoplasmatales archaeon]|nr:MAG: 50S ribosomal protein L5 [Thermoplasmata archaeon]HDI23878.1 50S ribosomal protein L5 [Thermoplasmatales archaeon]